MATLLPNAKQQFFNGNGQPLAGGSVYMYVPNTTTFKNTWKDSAQTTLNTNPIILDANGEALIYGAGAYRQQVYDNLGNLQWDASTQDLTNVLQGQTVLWCGNAGGTGDEITLTTNPAITALTAGQNFEAIASAANSGALMTINISSLGYKAAQFRGSTPPANLFQSGHSFQIVWNGTNFDILSPAPAVFDNDIVNSPNITVYPTGNSAIVTLTSFNIQANASSNTEREFLACIGFTSAVGGPNNGPPNYPDKVALYAATTGNTGTSNIWSINTVTTVATAGSGLYNADGYECDVNNNSGNDYADLVSGPAYSCYGVAAAMGGTNKSTSGFVSTCFSGGCWYGYAVAGTNFLNAAYLDLSSGIVNGIKMYGAKTAALIDLSQASPANSQGILFPQGVGLYSENIAGSSAYNLVEASGTNIIIGDAGYWTNILLRASTAVYAGSDNAVSLGTAANRFSVVYAATGTINTSDESQKFDITPLPNNMLDFVKQTNPIAYKNKQGGIEKVEIQQEEDVPVYEDVTISSGQVQIINGKPTWINTPIIGKQKIYDEFPVVDEKGNLVYETKPAKDAVKDQNGKIIIPATPETKTQKLHRIERKQKQTVTKTINQPRVGKRTHFGFSAQKIQQATANLKDFSGNQLDFAGFTQDPETGLCGLRYDQLIPILWKAVQELSVEVETLKKAQKS